MKECIRVEGLSKKYGKKEIVKAIDFQVEQGQIFALLGPNGAGKSTTMNMVAALLRKTEGTIFINGLNLDDDQDRIKRKIGIVFQEDILDGDLTVHKNLIYRGGLYSSSSKQLAGQIQRICDLLSLQELLPKKYSTCAGGQKRLVQLARALIPEPRLLVLDEPTTGLDPMARQNVWRVLLLLKEKLNMTIFFTTHDMEEASYSDKICVLNNGSILLCDALSNIQTCWSGRLKQPNLNDIYLHLLRKETKNEDFHLSVSAKHFTVS